MVKVSFNTALAQKDVKKDGETLIPTEKDPEAPEFVHRQPRAWCWCFWLGLTLMFSGVVVGGAYLYRYYVLEGGQVYVCGVKYIEDDYMVREEEEAVLMEGSPAGLRFIKESVFVLEDEQVEEIHVPVPEFGESDPADIVHDFNKRLTAYLDLNLDKCYVIPLNTSVVMPPRDLVDLLINIKAGTYLPQTYLVHEQMIVTEKLDDMDELGFFISKLCRGKDIYRLQRRDSILGMQKREAPNCHKIRHFVNKFVVETEICEL